MPRQYSETRAVKGGIWIQREKSRGRKLEKKRQRMRNTLSGAEGQHQIFTHQRWRQSVLTCNVCANLFSSLKSTCVYSLAQSQMQQQKLEDAVHEAQKPLARHCDDEDLDRMLREQEREGDPMAAMLRRKKDRTTKTGFEALHMCCNIIYHLQNIL